MQKSVTKHASTSKKNAKRVKPAPSQKNEGEGSRTAARKYDAGATRAAANPERVEELAKAAEKAVDGAEGKELRAAEERGKRGEHH